MQNVRVRRPSRRGCKTRHLHQRFLALIATPISDKRYRINQFIRIPRVMVIDDQNANLGEMDTAAALAMAQAKGLDLVEIAPMARPPVCKILDFNAFQFQQEKQERKAKARQKKVELKGIRLTFRIGQHDRDTRKAQTMKFLDDGNKVMLEMRLRGRENAHPEFGQKVIEDFIADLGPGIVVEQKLSRLGNRFTTIIGKKK